MTKYKVLVVDDQPRETKKLFENLFSGDSQFIFTQAARSSDFESATFSDYDAILLDINLDQWQTEKSEAMTLTYALSKIGNHCPVALVSRVWNKDTTHRRMSEALASESNIKFIATFVLNDLMGLNWKDYAESLRGQLYLAINTERQRASLDRDDGEDVCILHISDPQYGDKGTDNWSAYVEKDIGQYVRYKLDLDIHLIAITGDISFSGQVSEFMMAEEKLPKLFNFFFPNKSDWRERVLIVPGNHDVNLRLAAADLLNIGIKDGKLSVNKRKKLIDGSPHRKFALAPFRNFAWRLTGDPRWKESDELNWVNDSFKHLGLRFFMLNSVSNLDCISHQKAGFKSNVIDELKGGEEDQPFGIAFSHHGPPEKEYSGADILDEWPETAGFLNNREIKLFIHGHGHERKVDKFHLRNQTTKPAKGQIKKGNIIRVMAPTTHLDGSKRPDGQLRGFNIITLHRAHGKVTGVEVKSYEFDESKMEPIEMEESPSECVI